MIAHPHTPGTPPATPSVPCSLVKRAAGGFDFSPTLRDVLQTPGVTQELLARIAGTSPSTVCRMVQGSSQPDVNTLKAWADSPVLPASFGQACATPIVRAADAVVIVVNADDESLDVDGDRQITARDARLLAAQEQHAAAKRQEHFERAIDDGRITPDEVAVDSRLAHEVVTCSERRRRVVQRLVCRTY